MPSSLESSCTLDSMAMGVWPSLSPLHLPTRYPSREQWVHDICELPPSGLWVMEGFGPCIPHIFPWDWLGRYRGFRLLTMRSV